MKLDVSTKEFRDALNRISSIPGANGASIHTQIVTLEAGMAGLTLSRFTSEAKITLTLEEGVVVHDEDGRVHVAHSVLLKQIGLCGHQVTQLASTDKGMDIKSGKDPFKIKSIDDALLPEPPSEDESAESVTILMEDLVEMLSFAVTAVSQDSANSFVFCGVCIRSVDGRAGGKELHFMATDKKRAHVAIGDYDLDVDCIVPTEGVEAIVKAIGGQTGPCQLSIGGSMLRITSDRLDISVTLIGENYPDSVQKFLAQPDASIHSRIVVPKVEFVEVLKKCAAINEDDSRIARMEVEKKVLTLSGGNAKDSEFDRRPIDCEATGAGTYGVPARTLAQSLEWMEPADDGTIELIQFPTAIFVKQPQRMAFWALSKAT